MKYPHLAAQIFNVPLLVHPQKLDAIIAGLGMRLLGTEITFDETETALPADLFSTRRGEPSDGGYMVSDGVAVLFASGALVHRSRFKVSDSTYFVGYNELTQKLEAAIDDPEVHAVLQVYDSPGGEAAGAFEYGDRIFGLRGKKPIWAVADSMAASAAYLAGSAFDQLAVSGSGYAGSIGVVLRHIDVSRALANEGVLVKQIFAGAHKVDGNPYEPLPPAVQADLQAEIDGLYGQFVQAVARNRGMTEKAVRATQAQTYRAAAAVDIGLADRVATTDELISELAALRVRSYPVGQSARSTASEQGGSSMSGNTTGGQSAAQLPALPVALTRESLERDHPALFSLLRNELVKAERDRIVGVLAAGAAMPGHERLVEQCIAEGKAPGDAALAILQAVGAKDAEAAQRHLADSPAAAPHSAAPDESGGSASEGAAGRAAVALYEQAMGITRKGAQS